MGYTHYWEIADWDFDEWQKTWPKIINDVPRIIEASGVSMMGPMALPDENTENDDDEYDEDDDESVTPPLVDIKKGIFINGIEKDIHEDS
ncbi:uncharacterized protein N7483_010635 [Penicillium malachiteum]|uniref:uncharacterized protein n=1 Tax=Penicillium malachiteum TaxID=1324776 RepID=UPI0025469C8F|nr:uncharacterized protein N7483_010635 [Penicillium malachiteum]KAJ5713454.1 hypothetical protein N7483_010635 [Penicillium malachiteum]